MSVPITGTDRTYIDFLKDILFVVEQFMSSPSYIKLLSQGNGGGGELEGNAKKWDSALITPTGICSESQKCTDQSLNPFPFPLGSIFRITLMTNPNLIQVPELFHAFLTGLCVSQCTRE